MFCARRRCRSNQRGSGRGDQPVEDKVARSNQMRLIGAKNTKPEMRVRRFLWRMGFRYRLHTKGMPGKPDLVFKGRCKVVFVNGCFWHQHPDPNCQLARMPKSRLSYWQPKLSRNRIRDEENYQILQSQGWSVFVVWECELRNSEEDVLSRLVQFLESDHERTSLLNTV